MSPETAVVLKYGLLALLFAAFAVGIWASSRMMKRASQSGYGSFDPRFIGSAWNSPELPIFIISLLVGMVSVMAIRAFGLG